MWRYTPRRTFAYCFFHHANRLSELRENLAVASLGAHGDSDDIKAQMRAWEV